MANLRVATFSYVSLLSMTGCVLGDADAAREPAPTADAAQESDAEPDASPRTGRPCNHMWGALLIPPSEDAQRISSIGAEGRVYLLADPDRMHAVTTDGRTSRCQWGLGNYNCGAGDDDIEKVFVSLGDQQWTQPSTCENFAAPTDIFLENASCVASGTTVVEGDLVDLDPERPPEIWLEGPLQKVGGSLLISSSDQSSVVGTRCALNGKHYTCPTVGYASTVMHALAVGGVRSELELPVEACRATRVQLDVNCTAVRAEFFVAAPPETDRHSLAVTASYEGGPAYACTRTEAPRHDALKTYYGCPPAPGNERGRGTYHIAARARDRSQLAYEASATDVFDGCGGSREPILLTR